MKRLSDDFVLVEYRIFNIHSFFELTSTELFTDKGDLQSYGLSVGMRSSLAGVVLY